MSATDLELELYCCVAQIKEEPKPKKALKRSELATEAVVKELQSLYQDNPDSCVKSTPPLSTTSAPSHLIRGCVVVVYIAEIKWDRSNKTVSVQLSNAEHGTVNLSIYLADDTNPVTMLESVSGHVDENKVEVFFAAGPFSSYLLPLGRGAEVTDRWALDLCRGSSTRPTITPAARVPHSPTSSTSSPRVRSSPIVFACCVRMRAICGQTINDS